ncbi:prepilin-type N-terminal cleavage/methylation domain-containing protein [Candidatus Sumerlaeota bacterium]|nr:prepilin-type N-terminal cleavage/methylation domain-containing protein [Candidatus Sumerlaeota bacterium]
MTVPVLHKYKCNRRGFTLLEILASTFISAILLSSLYTVFHGALKLREKTYAQLESGLPGSYIGMILRRDIVNMAPPTGILAGAVIGETNEVEGYRQDRMEFFATSGIINKDDPWGDILKVEYFLQETEEELEEQEGLNLVRGVTRNLLSPIAEEPEETILLEGVQSLEITYFDGATWQDSWDSTVVENEAPRAVRIRMDFAPIKERESVKAPLEFTFEISTQGASTP